MSLDGSPTNEVQELFQLILDCIKGLFQLSRLIKKLTPRDRFQVALQNSKLRFPDSFDIAHVGEKFAKLSQGEFQWLKVRLGRVITQRRCYLAYSRDHHEQLKNPGPKMTTSSKATTKNQSVAAVDELTNSGTVKAVANFEAMSAVNPPSIMASTKASTLQVADLARHQAFDDMDDALSYTTIGSDILEAEEQILQVPSLETVGPNNVLFECPFCHEIQSFRRQRAWR